MAKKRSPKRQSRIPTGPSARRSGGEGGRSHEIAGIVTLGFSIFFVTALLSLQLGSGTLMGPLGRSVAVGGYALVGSCAYVLVLGIAGASLRLLLDRRPVVRPPEAVSMVLGLLSLGALLHLCFGSYRVAGHPAGGLAGEHVAEVLRALISTAGTALLAAIGLAVAIVIATPFRMRQVLAVIGRGLSRAWRLVRQGTARAVTAVWRGASAAGSHTARFVGDVVRAILPERNGDEYELEYEDDDEDDVDVMQIDEGQDAPYVDPPIIMHDMSGRVATPIEETADMTIKMDDAQIAANLAAEHKRTTLAGVPAVADVEASAAGPKSKAKAKPTIEQVAEAKSGSSAPEIVESQFRKQDENAMHEREKRLDAERGFIKLGDGDFQLPPISLLDYDATESGGIDHATMLELSARLLQALGEFKVKGEVTAIRPGPVVTMYEFAPAPGTRLKSITNLQHEVAMALGATGVRIVAPIPGKSVVGFEIPNKARETVYLKEIIADDVFRKGKSGLPLALGKDIDGAPVVVDLAKMPHLLVAGTTGSGKSVSVNSMIVSLLYNSSPEDVRLIMVDPKMLELSIYEGIPHLLLPVVTDPKKANLALRWAVEEMDRRYDLLATLGVRDINTYNRKVGKLQKQWEAEQLERAAEEARRIADEEEPVEVTEERGQLDLAFDEHRPPKRLPKIVVIIDEFADLMMCAPKEVETSVARIAQKARAAGIHLIIATQRPSVDVITGLIKANFPSRAAFRVTAKVDSRTILDTGGAEALLGSGDMLFSDRGREVRRLHGCYLAEDEIREIVAFLKTQGKPVYNLDIIRPRDDDADAAPEDSEEADEMYDRAVALVAEARQVSISMIQRRLRVGYNRAARMVEMMEREGVVSPPDGTNRREVLVAPAA
jgi:S-DNA-T family DNA segregation ATPase FtsK/SpoIIIE